MRSGRSVLGVMAGVLLALGVVALTGSGFNPYTSNTSGAPVSNPVSGTTSSTATGQEGQNPTFSASVGAVHLSQVNSIAKQPVTLTGFVLLPIFAAFLFGFILYRASKVRNEEEEAPEAA